MHSLRQSLVIRWYMWSATLDLVRAAIQRAGKRRGEKGKIGRVTFSSGYTSWKRYARCCFIQRSVAACTLLPLVSRIENRRWEERAKALYSVLYSFVHSKIFLIFLNLPKSSKFRNLHILENVKKKKRKRIRIPINDNYYQTAMALAVGIGITGQIQSGGT